MDRKSGLQRIHPLWWTAALIVTVIGLITLSIALFSGKISRSVPVVLTSDRAGLVMYTGARVKMRGVEVGHVATINAKQGGPGVRLQLDIDRDQIKYIPANVGAQIKATTAFGTKYVDLIYPDDPSPKRLTSGQVL